jgi:hypothetical protein
MIDGRRRSSASATPSHLASSQPLFSARVDSDSNFAVSQLFDLYSRAKQQLSETLGASEDLLHLHAGLLIFFAAALLFKRRMRSRVPIALVYAFAVGNEIVDLMSPERSSHVWEPAFDIANTVAWPTLLFLLARRRGKVGEPDKTA